MCVNADCLSSQRVVGRNGGIIYLDVAHDGLDRHPSIGSSIDDQDEAELPFVVTRGEVCEQSFECCSNTAHAYLGT